MVKNVKIKIRNFGPIKSGLDANDGFIEISKVTLFCGPQGSGKSTVAKVLSSMMWLEKAAYYVGWDLENAVFDDAGAFMRDVLSFHGLTTYFTESTEISYRGNYLSIDFEHGRTLVQCVDRLNVNYVKPKIMYMPAERNFLHYLEFAVASRLLPPPLVALLGEYKAARAEIQDTYSIPINGYRLVYDADKDDYFIENVHSDGKPARTPIPESSSGLQSLLPMSLVTNYLSAHIGHDARKSPDINSLSLSNNPFLASTQEKNCVYNGSSLPLDGVRFVRRSTESSNCFVNIVEEPEQNLFPPTQRRVLRHLLEVNNARQNNRLIISTHSPYIVSDLVAATKANKLFRMRDGYKGPNEEAFELLEKCYPERYSVSNNDVRLYETNYDGSIKLDACTNGIINDSNFLNRHLRLGNMLFDELCGLEDVLAAGDRVEKSSNAGSL